MSTFPGKQPDRIAGQLRLTAILSCGTLVVQSPTEGAPMDPYQLQELIERVSDRLVEDEPAAAVAIIASECGLDLYAVAEQMESD